LYVCDEHVDSAHNRFDSLAIGDHFTVVPWDYNLSGEWVKLSVMGIPNPAYPNLMCNAERVEKTGKGIFAPGDRDYEWVMATMQVEKRG
jgi:hypothetical protein